MSYKLVFDVQTDGLRLFWLILLPLATLLFAFILTGALPKKGGLMELIVSRDFGKGYPEN